MKTFMERALELIVEDKQLHDAMVAYLKARAAHHNALARRALKGVTT